MGKLQQADWPLFTAPVHNTHEEAMKRLFPPKLEQLPLLMEWIETSLIPIEFDLSALRKLQLASEEAFVNIIRHSLQKEGENIEVDIHFVPQRYIEISFRDKGAPFDPTEIKEPDLSSDLEERKIGGLGIFFIRKLTDEIRYRREENQNVFTFKIIHSSQKK